MKKKSDLKKLKEKTWSIFSKYIRLKYSDNNGNCKCVTCGKIKNWKEMQAGHFVPSRCNAVLFNEKIVFPQCVGCNVMLNGNYHAYFRFMIQEKKYTPEELFQFMELKHKIVKISYSDMEEIYNKYKNIVDSIIK